MTKNEQSTNKMLNITFWGGEKKMSMLQNESVQRLELQLVIIQFQFIKV